MSSDTPGAFAQRFGYPALRYFLLGLVPATAMQTALRMAPNYFATHATVATTVQFLTDTWGLFCCIVVGIILATALLPHIRRLRNR